MRTLGGRGTIPCSLAHNCPYSFCHIRAKTCPFLLASGRAPVTLASSWLCSSEPLPLYHHPCAWGHKTQKTPCPQSLSWRFTLSVSILMTLSILTIGKPHLTSPVVHSFACSWGSFLCNTINIHPQGPTVRVTRFEKYWFRKHVGDWKLGFRPKPHRSLLPRQLCMPGTHTSPGQLTVLQLSQSLETWVPFTSPTAK